MELGGDVREQRKRGWRYAHLRRVQDANGAPSRAWRRIRLGNRLDEAIQLRRGHTVRALLQHLVDHLEQFRRALPRERRNVEDGRELQKFELEAQLVAEFIGKVFASGFDQIPFV